MDIAELRGYGYFILITLFVIVLYAYIYHLYKVRKDADGHDYEEYSNLALQDDIASTPVNAISDDKEK